MTDSSNLRLLMFTCIIFRTAAHSLSCYPEEEFKPHTFKFNFTNSDSDYMWCKQNDKVAGCLPSEDCYVDQKYFGILEAFISGPTFLLNITNVTKESAGVYSCRDLQTQEIVYSCDFRVYARPTSVFCQQPEAQAHNVTIVCTVEQIFPSAVCQFSWFTNNTEMSVPQTINYQTLSVKGQSEYFYMNCSLTILVQDLILGSHEFRVTAYPNVTGQTNDIEYGRSSNRTSPVIINYPTVKLESCPDSYVQEGTTISCTCRETSNTFLPANTSFTAGSTTSSYGTWYTTYNFIFNRTLGEITCQAKLLNWTSIPVKYTPQVAYGPDTVILKLIYNQMDLGFIDLCDKNQTVVLIASCSVPENGINPKAVYQFYINGTQMLQNPSISSAFIYAVSKAGPLSVQCTGYNSKFLTLSASSQEAIIEVTEPPISPPIIDKYQEDSTYNTGTHYILTVQEGINRIRCRVEGGYPSVTNVSLECGTHKNTSLGNEISLDLNVTRHMDVSGCSCTSTHKSSCYRNNKSISKLDVLYPVTPGSNKDTEVNVGAVVGGIVAGILAIVAVVLAVFCLKNKDQLRNDANDRCTNGGMQTYSLEDSPYRNIVQELPEGDDPLNTSYVEIDDVQPEYSSDHGIRSFHDMQDKTVNYENAVIPL